MTKKVLGASAQRKIKVLLVGGLPRPSGGVSVFLGRLVNAIGEKVEFDVLDVMDYGAKEPNLAKRIRVAPRNRLLKHLWVFMMTVISNSLLVHFNYSSLTSLAALALLPKLNKKFVVILHNGQQHERYLKTPRILKLLIKLGARRTDLFFSLCDDHVKLYNLLDVEGSKIKSIKPQIPPKLGASEFLDREHKNLAEKYEDIVISSGHVSKTYNFEYTINFVNNHPDTAAMFFFYGQHQDMTYLGELRDLIEDKDNVLFYFHQPEKVFLSALAASQAYLRPTSVDSWGIAIADAILLGVPVVASDVCERFPGATLCDADDYEGFSKLVEEALIKNKNSVVDNTEHYDASPIIYKSYRDILTKKNENK